MFLPRLTHLWNQQAKSLPRRSVTRVFHATAVPSSSHNNNHHQDSPPSYTIIPKDDHGPFREYSVIHTDRSLNLMSEPFQRVMRDLNALLKYTYQAERVVIVPG